MRAIDLYYLIWTGLWGVLHYDLNLYLDKLELWWLSFSFPVCYPSFLSLSFNNKNTPLQTIQIIIGKAIWEEQIRIPIVTTKVGIGIAQIFLRNKRRVWCWQQNICVSKLTSERKGCFRCALQKILEYDPFTN